MARMIRSQLVVALAACSLCFMSLVACAGGGGDEEDGPTGWAAVAQAPQALQYGAVWAFAPDNVWITAESGRLFQFDGHTWNETSIGAEVMVLGIWAFAADDVWMVGGNTLIRYDGSEFTATDLATEAPGVEGLTSIWGSAPDDVWVVGSQSTAAHFNGTSWTRMIAAGTDNSSVWGSGLNDVYVVGLFDTAHWDGASFSNLELNVFSGASSVFGFAADDVWLGGDSNEVAHWDGGSWEVTEIDAKGGPARLWGAAPDDLWGVGNFGSISHFDGSEWTELESQSIGSDFLLVLNGVHGSSAEDAWAIGTKLNDDGAFVQLWRYLKP
jgi:hypothetical protein